MRAASATIATPRFVEHRLETLLSQRIHGLVLGHEDLIDHDDLRFDPALGLLSDTLRPKREEPSPGQVVVAKLAGKSTLNRLEYGLMNGASRYCKIGVDDNALEQVFLDLYVDAHVEPPKQVMLDLDATDDPLHGAQEGRFFHGYYRCYRAGAGPRPSPQLLHNIRLRRNLLDWPRHPRDPPRKSPAMQTLY